MEFSESIRGSQWDDGVFDEGDTIELTVTSPKPKPLVFKLRSVPHCSPSPIVARVGPCMGLGVG